MDKLSVILVILLPMQGLALPWSKDMKDQPTIKAQETVVSMAKSSVRSDSPEPVQRPTISMSWLLSGSPQDKV